MFFLVLRKEGPHPSLQHSGAVEQVRQDLSKKFDPICQPGHNKKERAQVKDGPGLTPLALRHRASRVCGSGRRPDFKGPTRSEKGDIEDLEQVELSEYKRDLIRRGPGQNEPDWCQLPDDRLDRDTAGLNLRQGPGKTQPEILGVPVEP
jgi:hypothetical protein